MTLKQGFGRLLRTQEDAGVVAILDRRLVARGYGRMLLASLPPARRVASLDDLAAAYRALGFGDVSTKPVGRFSDPGAGPACYVPARKELP